MRAIAREFRGKAAIFCGGERALEIRFEQMKDDSSLIPRAAALGKQKMFWCVTLQVSSGSVLYCSYVCTVTSALSTLKISRRSGRMMARAQIR